MTGSLGIVELVVLAAFAFADPPSPPDGDQPVRLADAVRSQLAALDEAHDPAAIDALFDACQLRHGDLAPLLAELEAEEASDDPIRAAEAKRIVARLLWRLGDLRTAATRLDQVVEAAPTARDRLDRAYLLDASGRTTDAFEAYRALVDEVTDDGVREKLLIRLALMGLDRDDDEAGRLAELARAEGRDEDARRRAAVVLAISERPREAIDLFAVEGEGSERFRGEMRIAEWALEADDPALAREAAWRANLAARLDRDRRYALTVLAEAYREGDELPLLVRRLATAVDLDDESRRLWIDLLRETGEIDLALQLFRSAAEGDGFTVEMRRELLEMCREAGREDELVVEYERLVAAEPRTLEWRFGLARHHLERGDAAAAEGLLRPLVDDPSFASLWMECAEQTRELGRDALAAEFAERVIASGDDRVAPAFLFLFELDLGRGRPDAAEATLTRFDAATAADAAARGALAESYEKLGRLDRAVEILEQLRVSRGEDRAGEDLEMRLAWLHSEVGDEEKALERWQGLWIHVESVARRRYVEDRLMAVAARIGKLADVAIDLERRLVAGDASDRDAGLLVRLYTKANDPVSAAEVLEEFMKGTGSSEVAILQEKARVYLACTDYYGFEEVLRELLVVDPEHRVDHLRQLAMSQLERGKPDEARGVLAQLREIEGGVEGAEFEAGVLALGGLRDEAIRAYRKGIAAHEDRIEAYLLLANVLRDEGEAKLAIGMFQFLAEHAEKDDLFTVAIDGLLNMEAPSPVLKWARRITLERLARRHEKMYLYQLLADLSEQLGEPARVLDAMEAALPIAGERRASLLRELMDLAASGRRSDGDRPRQLMYGRRLVGLAEIVPPQVYLELGRAFLENDEPAQASKTFGLASDLPDHDVFQADVARAFEEARYVDDALRVYERSLVSRSSDVDLIAKVAELHERLGRDDVAQPMFARALDLLLGRRPRSTSKADDDEEDDRFRGFNRSRNVDDWGAHSERVITGLLATTTPGASVDAQLDRERARIDAELAAPREDGVTLEQRPRLAEAARVHRRVAFAFGRPAAADAVDARLLDAFPDEDDLLESLVRARMERGLVRSARALVDGSGRGEAERRRVRTLTGAGGVTASSGTLPPSEVVGLFLPALAEGRTEDAKSLLRRVDFSKADGDGLDAVETLFGAATLLNDPDLMLKFGRQWIQSVVRDGPSGGRSWVVQGVLDRCGRVLDDELEWILAQSVVALLLDERLKEKVKDLVEILPALQKKFERPLIEPDEVTELLIERFSGSPWGAGLMFEMVPVVDRTRVLREVWPKVAKTQRASFVLNLASELTTEVAPEFADLLVESFVGALAESDESDFLRYRLGSVIEAGSDPALALRLLDAATDNGIDHLSLKVSRAALLGKVSRADEASEAALLALRAVISEASRGDQNDWETRRALGQLYVRFLPAHVDAFLGELDQLEAEAGSSSELAMTRIDVIGTRGDDEATLAAVRLALEAHPEDEPLLRRLESALNGAGRHAEALEVLERVILIEDDERQRERDRNRVVRGWSLLRHPERALSALEDGEDDASADDEDDAKEEARARKLPVATIKRLKEAVDRGDEEAARGLTRRLWRGESSGPPAVRYMSINGVLTQVSGGYLPPIWPPDREDEAQDESSEKERDRGGLPDWVTDGGEGASEESRKPEPTRTVDVLVRHAFGRDESWRRLRTLSGPALARETATFDALAADLASREGRAEASRRLLDTIESGAGGLVEYALVLALVAQAPEAIGVDEREMLADVLRTVRADDADAIRRLARVFARTGDVATAARLFRWCATRTDDGGGMFIGEGTRKIAPKSLIDDVRENLDGEDRLSVIDAILAWSEPGVMSWRLEAYEELALGTWEELLGPAGALARGRALCEAVLLPPETAYDSWRRRSAQRVAWLFAAAGELDQAVRALEVATARMDDDDREDASFRFLVGGGIMLDREGAAGWLGRDALLRLFPRTDEGFASPDGRVAWLLRAGESLSTWARAGRLRSSTAVEALVVLAVRLGEAGHVDVARELLDTAEVVARGASTSLLWIADARRALGDDRAAAEVERSLFDRGALHAERVPDVVRRALEVDGPAAAFRIGDAALERTRHPDLFEVLLEAADRAGDQARAARLAEGSAARDAAEEALDLKLEALRKKSS